MRGTSRDAVQTVFTLMMGVFVIYAIYSFGTEIFMAGAKINISGEAGSFMCFCKDADADAEIDCGNGMKIKCFKCDQVPVFGWCSSEQTLDVDKIQIYEKKIQVCYIVQAGTGNRIKISVNGEQIENKYYSVGKLECVDHEFSSETSVKQIKADSGTGSNMDRLILKWGLDSQASK